jgi:hypothetical protein
MRDVSFLGAQIEAPQTDSGHAVRDILEQHVPLGARLAVHEAGTQIIILDHNEQYLDRSKALKRLNARVDDWPVPPAGLFVVEERTLYLRSCSPMTVVHEYGHALDCALGNGIYYSGLAPEIRHAFKSARAFVTPYAATGLDEYVAECLRSLWSANDERSPRTPASPKRLRELDRTIYDVLQGILERLEHTAAKAAATRTYGTTATGPLSFDDLDAQITKPA